VQATEHSTPVKVPEILAPAGGPAAFFAALNAGADAVYLGLDRFNARARAQNFDIDTLASILPTARRHGLKVLVTLNILIKEVELAELMDTLAALAELDVHALIVQDLGLVRLCQEHFPEFRLHASTQMAIHNLAGVVAAKDLGIRRVVLARELTAAEMRRIRKDPATQEVQLEAFCHGSLCYAYSGLCFFSGAEDGRSGNRGECAYTCRKPYRIISEPGGGFLFSMKDLNTIGHLGTLVGTGIDALKIEGRKKDAQYVMSAVEAYRRALDDHFGFPTLRASAPEVAHSLHRPGQSLEDQKTLRQDLALSFNRGETSFFLMGRYRENVIDLSNPTHLGQRVGNVLEATWSNLKTRQGTQGDLLITFVTNVALQRFDGMRLEPEPKSAFSQGHEASSKYHNQVMAFSLRDMMVNGRRTHEAAPGDQVTVVLPSDVTEPWGHCTASMMAGLEVYRTRSSALKAKAEALGKPHDGQRLKPEKFYTAALTITKGNDQDSVTELILNLELRALGPVASCESAEDILRIEKQACKATPRQKPVACGQGLEADLRDMLSTFDEGQIRITFLDIHLNPESPSLDSLFVPRSQLKDLKRQLNAQVVDTIKAKSEQRKLALACGLRPSLVHSPSETPRLHVKMDRRSTLDALASCRQDLDQGGLPLGEVIIEVKRHLETDLSPQKWISDWLGAIKRHDLVPLARVRLALPTVLRAWDEPLMEHIVRAAWDAGVRAFEVGNLGAMSLLRRWGVCLDTSVADHASLSTDFTLFALNHFAASALGSLGAQRVALSVEDDAKNLRAHLQVWPQGNPQPEVILYKDTPLFLAESCSLTALHGGCPTSAVCGYRSLEIEDDEGHRYFVAHEACKSVVYAKEAFSISHARHELTTWGVRHFRADFLTRPYTEAEVSRILQSLAGAQKVRQTVSANYGALLL
jgi:putative protease